MRSALEWSFGPGGDPEIRTALASAAAWPFLQLSLLTECHRWTGNAIAELDDSTRGTRRELELQVSLGHSLMFTLGNSEDVRVAFTRGLDLAESLGELEFQLRLLGALQLFHQRRGDFGTTLAVAQRSAAVAERLADPAGIAAAQSFLGVSHHLIGNHANARIHFVAALASPPQGRTGAAIHFGFDHLNRARICLARTLFLQGYPDEAVAVARYTVDEAATLDHPVTLCIALIWAVSVFIWTGDWTSAREGYVRARASTYVRRECCRV